MTHLPEKGAGMPQCPLLRRSCHTVGVVGEQNTPCDVRMQRFEGEFDHWHRVGCVGMCCNPFAMVASEIRTACWFMTIHCTVTGTCKRQGVVTGSVEPWFGLVWFGLVWFVQLRLPTFMKATPTLQALL